MWALRLGVALYRYWEHREYLAEGRTWLEAILELPGDAEASTATRIGALSYVSAIALVQGDFGVSVLRTREALEMCRELGDRKGVITQLNALYAHARWRGSYLAAREWAEQTLQACGDLGDKAAIAAALSNLADVIFLLGHHREAQARLEQASAMFAEMDDATGMAWCANHLGDIALELGDIAEARRLYEAGADIFRKTDNRWGLARSACDLGHLACEEASYDSARAFFRSALTVFRELEHKRGLALALEGLARLAHEEAEPARALTLAGAAAALRRATGAVVRSEDDRKLERTRDRAFAQCDPAFSKQAWTKGWHMPTDEALRLRAHELARTDCVWKFAGSTSRRTASIRSTGAPAIRPCSRMSLSSGAK